MTNIWKIIIIKMQTAHGKTNRDSSGRIYALTLQVLCPRRHKETNNFKKANDTCAIFSFITRIYL